MSETSSSSSGDFKGPKDPEATRLREELSLHDDSDQTPGDQTRVLDPRATYDLGNASGSESQVTEEPQREQIGRYRVIELLGVGGFGSVYLAHDDVLRRNVSIKLPHRRRVSTAAQLQRYMNEAMMVAQLDHPKIVPVFDVGQLPDGLCYVVSKYIECETLSDAIKRPMTARTAIEIAIDLAETLQHVHEAGIVHRDMKPANVLVSRDGTYFINDFGLAMIEVSESDQGVMVGTPAYMSPEQAFGEGHLVDGRSDIFSLGVMLYEMLVGRRPFRGGSTEQILYQVREREPKPMRQLNRALPVALERVCQKALAKQTGNRCSSALDFANDLRRVLDQWDGLETGTVEYSDSASRSTSSGSVSNSVSGMSAPTTSGDDGRVVVIPKGLRSYDQQDAAFFKARLPGPYDLDGCPESIRFWIHRIDPPRGVGPIAASRQEMGGRGIEPFRVGVIYGTSGCGKSSFIRAGLIPMLEETVRVCIVDATATGTLERLDQALSQRVPTFDEIPRLRSDSGKEPTIKHDFDAEARPGRAPDGDFDDQASAPPVGQQDPFSVPIDKRMASIRRGEQEENRDRHIGGEQGQAYRQSHPCVFWDGVDADSGIASDWGMKATSIKRSTNVGGWSNFVLSAHELVHRDPDAHAYLLLQDDAMLASLSGLREYVEGVLRSTGMSSMVSLYCCELDTQPRNGWHRLAVPMARGAQAFVFGRDAMRRFLADPITRPWEGSWHNKGARPLE